MSLDRRHIIASWSYMMAHGLRRPDAWRDLPDEGGGVVDVWLRALGDLDPEALDAAVTRWVVSAPERGSYDRTRFPSPSELRALLETDVDALGWGALLTLARQHGTRRPPLDPRKPPPWRLPGHRAWQRLAWVGVDALQSGPVTGWAAVRAGTDEARETWTRAVEAWLTRTRDVSARTVRRLEGVPLVVRRRVEHAARAAWASERLGQLDRLWGRVRARAAEHDHDPLRPDDPTPWSLPGSETAARAAWAGIDAVGGWAAVCQVATTGEGYGAATRYERARDQRADRLRLQARAPAAEALVQRRAGVASLVDGLAGALAHEPHG